MTLFKPGEIRIILLVTLGITIIGIAIAFIVSLSRTPQPVMVEFESEKTDETVNLSDFLIENRGVIEDFSYKEARPVKDRWSQEEIEQFWIDPGKAGLKQLSAENDELIRQYFDAVP